MGRSHDWLPVLAVGCLAALCGCASEREIRLENISSLDFTEVSVAGRPYGSLAAGATSEYRRVVSKSGYAVVRLTADGRKVNAQTLSPGARRLTFRVDVVDLVAGHLAVDLVRD